MPHKGDLLDGSDDHIVQSNFSTLRNKGMSEPQAWHLALKKANKSKSVNKTVKKVISKPRNPSIALKKPY